MQALLASVERNLAADRVMLLGHENDAEAPLTDLLQ
jgi:hypothetical protein